MNPCEININVQRFTSIELVWSSALWCFLGRYAVLKHWSGCLSLKTAVGNPWFYTKHIKRFPASCNGVIARFCQWQGQKQVCDLTQIVWVLWLVFDDGRADGRLGLLSISRLAGVRAAHRCMMGQKQPRSWNLQDAFRISKVFTIHDLI